MKIHRDDFQHIVQEVIYEYDGKIKIAIEILAPLNQFKINNYCDVMDITKKIMFKKETLYTDILYQKYPQRMKDYIESIYYKIIERLNAYVLDKCKQTNINTRELFEKSEPIEDEHFFVKNGKKVYWTVVGDFKYNPVDPNTYGPKLRKGTAVSDIDRDGIEEYKPDRDNSFDEYLKD